MTRHFIIEGQYLGQAPAYPPYDMPLIYLCKYCGEIYARLPIEGDEDGWDYWVCSYGQCRKCNKDREIVPGSIWDGYREFLNDRYPEKVVKYELMLLIKEVENGTRS